MNNTLFSYFIINSILIAFGLLSLIKGLLLLKERRLIEKIPTLPINALNSGIFAIEGKISRSHSNVYLKTPFTNLDCVYYKYQVQKYYGEMWITIQQHEDFLPFIVSDDTGEVLIDPKKANFKIFRHTTFDTKYNLPKFTNTQKPLPTKTLLGGDRTSATYRDTLATKKLYLYIRRLSKELFVS